MTVACRLVEAWNPAAEIDDLADDLRSSRPEWTVLTRDRSAPVIPTASRALRVLEVPSTASRLFAPRLDDS